MGILPPIEPFPGFLTTKGGEMNSDCVKGAQNEGRIKALEDRAEKNDADHKGFVETISDIRDRLLARPTWNVVVILNALVALCVGLMVAMFK